VCASQLGNIKEAPTDDPVAAVSEGKDGDVVSENVTENAEVAQQGEAIGESLRQGVTSTEENKEATAPELTAAAEDGEQ